MKQIKEKLKEIHEAMYNVNRQISWKYIAMKTELTERAMSDINRMMGEWIKQIRDIEEEIE